MKTKIATQRIEYRGKEVIGIKLTVSSQIPIDIEIAWKNVQKSALLDFISKGKVTFKPVNGSFPVTWKESEKVSTKMLLYGCIPFAGIHTLYFEKIDNVSNILQTTEYDNVAKIWNHKISMKRHNENSILYEDEIVIYGGLLTFFITFWAKLFYKHRQKRWQLVAKNNMKF